MAGGALIVGASLAGLRLAEQLRAFGYEGPLTLVGAEPHKPYNRPPLSKEVLLVADDAGETREAELAGLTFGLKPSLADVTWHLGSAAVSSDLGRRQVTLADGQQLDFEVLGIATGLTPRRLPFSGGDSARHVVRTFDDALRLRAALKPGVRVVVAGGGFIGCEAAATAAKRGAAVTIVESLKAPMCRAIGLTLATAIQDHHERQGIVFRLGTSIAGLELGSEEREPLTGVALSDGSVLPADVLIEAIGSTCNLDWLAGNDIDLTDGVLTDNFMLTAGRRDIAAVGDIARFANPRYGDTPRRVEHWAIPGFTAKRAAESLSAALLGREASAKAFNPIPTFWSDQFDLRMQSMGLPALGERSEVMEGSLTGMGAPGWAGVAMGYWQGQSLVGVVTTGLPVARLGHYRAMLN